MNLELMTLALCAALIAFMNGANDVSKGIATLVGSGVTNYRQAIVWGSLWTAIGGVVSLFAAKAMLTTFGSGMLTAGTSPTFDAAVATLLGAMCWILVATWRGLPVSTTHAIVGALVGVAAAAYGPASIQWGALSSKIILPLFGSPFIALMLTAALVRIERAASGSPKAGAECLCVGVEECAVVPSSQVSSLASLTVSGFAPVTVSLGEAGFTPQYANGSRLVFTSGSAAECHEARPTALRLTLSQLHWLTSGLTSLARSMNDAPKMAALVLAASTLSSDWKASETGVLLWISTFMVMGSLVAGLRVTVVLAEKVTRLEHREGFLANLVTSALVLTAAIGGLPLSTTHVSTGAIMGTAVDGRSHRLNRTTLRDMLLAWCVTAPVSAVLGVIVYQVIGTGS